MQITLRAQGMPGPNAKAQPIPLEPFAVNKDMGRLLLRRGGESIAAGKLDLIIRACFMCSFLPSRGRSRHQFRNYLTRRLDE